MTFRNQAPNICISYTFALHATITNDLQPEYEEKQPRLSLAVHCNNKRFHNQHL